MADLDAADRLIKSYKDCIFQAWGVDVHYVIPNLPKENRNIKGTDIKMLRRLVILCGLEDDYTRVKDILTTQCFRKIEVHPMLNPYHVTIEDLESTLAIVRNRSDKSPAIVGSQIGRNSRDLPRTEDLGVSSSGISNSITSTWNPSLVVGLSKKRRFPGIDEDPAKAASKRRRISENISQHSKELDISSLTENPVLAPGLRGSLNQLTPDCAEADMQQGSNDSVQIPQSARSSMPGRWSTARYQDIDIPVATPATITALKVSKELMGSAEDKADIYRLRTVFDETMKRMMARNDNRPEDVRCVVGEALGDFQHSYDKAEITLFYPFLYGSTSDDESTDEL